MIFEIQKEEVEALGTYLIERPWREANSLVLMLQNLKPKPDSPSYPKEDKPLEENKPTEASHVD